MPGLIDLQTNLRSLSYGSGAGEPFIRRPLPAYDEIPENPYLGANGIGRQGALFAANEDKVRLSKFFDRGSIFPLKQKLLSLQGPQGPYAPLRGTFRSDNIILQTSLGGTGTHINSRGAIPFGTKFTGYEYLTNTFYNGENSNRLNILYQAKIANKTLSGTAKASALAFGISDLGANTLFIYPGGGNAPLTIIKRADNNSTSGFKSGTGRNLNVFALTSTQIAASGINPTPGIRRDTSFNNIGNFILDLDGIDTFEGTRVIGRRTSYSEFNRPRTFGTGDPGNDALIDRSKYYEGVPDPKLTGVDKINIKKLYSTEEKEFTPQDDLIKFHIGVVDNNNPQHKTYIQFRAYVEGLSDNYSANWNSINYPGRGEEFFKYGGFTRDIGFSFKVHVGSRAELFPVYNKLNYLASIMAPDYSNPGFMRGNIVTLTVGDYINDMYGIITGFSYNFSDETSWDIARLDDGTPDPNSGELATLINVDSFSFKPIHNFLPRTVRDLDNPESRFISLGNALDGKGYGSDKRGL